ncbi:NUDIX domain-containing protein [Gordonia sp. CPCC 206044]|uniref:(deoxy)nucleoside triphosphate pyrophosphohydrolase n=1 Tax=Gordonia sp. CPCC 206044 TaxID=3140793 RepID=UPI003AF3EA7A
MTDRIVVAGAVVDRARGTLLLARRRYPAEVAGLWELPGGKVEPGETPSDALRRELDEELGVVVTVGAKLRADVRLRPGLTLIALRAEIVEGIPRAAEHAALQWVDATTLVEWAREGRLVPADSAWVPELVTELGGHDDRARDA